MAGNDIFLYSVPSDADQDDIRLRDPTQAGVPASTDPLGILTFDDVAGYDSDPESDDITYSFGPLPGDVIVAADQPAQFFEDGEEPDDTDYSFTFALQEDAQVYSLLLQDDETPPDEVDYDFMGFVIEDAAIYGLQAAIDEPEAADEGEDFTLAPLGDDFVVIDGVPFPVFEELADDDSEDTSFYSQSIFGDAVAPPAPAPESYTGGRVYDYLNPRRYRIDDDDEREELRKEIIKIGEATQSEVITGIVDTPRRKREPDNSTLLKLNRARVLADMARADRIRRIIAADDEWLMME